jgi:hypothetical protein
MIAAIAPKLPTRRDAADRKSSASELATSAMTSDSGSALASNVMLPRGRPGDT